MKGHAAVDPDSEIITDTAVTPGNASDRSVAKDLIDDLLSAPADRAASPDDDTVERPVVYGDNAYGTGEFQEFLERNDIDSRCKTQEPVAANGMFTKSDFNVDLEEDEVTCPNRVTVAIRRGKNGEGSAEFGDACADCPLRAQCTTNKKGRTIRIGRHEKHLAKARAPAEGPAVEGRLPGHPAKGRTQTRPPHAPPPRRTPRPSARHRQDRRRLQPPRPPRTTSPGWPEAGCAQSSPNASPDGRWHDRPARLTAAPRHPHGDKGNPLTIRPNPAADLRQRPAKPPRPRHGAYPGTAPRTATKAPATWGVFGY